MSDYQTENQLHVAAPKVKSAKKRAPKPSSNVQHDDTNTTTGNNVVVAEMGPSNSVDALKKIKPTSNTIKKKSTKSLEKKASVKALVKKAVAKSSGKKAKKTESMQIETDSTVELTSPTQPPQHQQQAIDEIKEVIGKKTPAKANKAINKNATTTSIEPDSNVVHLIQNGNGDICVGARFRLKKNTLFMQSIENCAKCLYKHFVPRISANYTPIIGVDDNNVTIQLHSHKEIVFEQNFVLFEYVKL